MDYNARYYDPSIMMFNQPDTLIPDPYNPLDWNSYAYARYNPVKYTDPSGHAVKCADGNEGGGCGSSSPKALLALKTIDTQKAVRDYVRARPHYHPEFDPAVRKDRTAYSEVAIAMMQVAQGGNGSTEMAGLSAIGGDVIVGRGDAFYAWDTDGNGAWMYDYGGGAVFPPVPYISIGSSFSITNAPSIDKLTGQGTSAGGTIGALGIFGISFEVDKFPDSGTNRVYTGVSFSVSFTKSPSPLAGWVYSTITNTSYLGGK